MCICDRQGIHTLLNRINPLIIICVLCYAARRCCGIIEEEKCGGKKEPFFSFQNHMRRRVFAVY